MKHFINVVIGEAAMFASGLLWFVVLLSTVGLVVYGLIDIIETIGRAL